MSRLLWVEDEPASVAPVLALLREISDLNIEIVGNISDSLRRVGEQHFDTIVVDLEVPLSPNAASLLPPSQSPTFNGVVIADYFLEAVFSSARSKPAPRVVFFSNHDSEYFHDLTNNRYQQFDFIQKTTALLDPSGAAQALYKTVVGAPSAATRRSPRKATSPATTRVREYSPETAALHDMRAPLGHALSLTKSVEDQLSLAVGSTMIPPPTRRNQCALKEGVAGTNR